MTTLALYTTATTDNDADVNKKLINKQNKRQNPYYLFITRLFHFIMFVQHQKR